MGNTVSLHPVSSSLVLNTSTMAGGPRNPEHRRRNRLTPDQKANGNELRRRTAAQEANTPPPAKLSNFETHMAKPIPKTLKPFLHPLESFLVNEWLVQYPDGARLRKFQRDVAWRMNRKLSPGKLDIHQHFLPIVGEFVRKELIEVRLDGKNRVLILQSPGTTAKKAKQEKEEAKTNAALSRG